MKDNADRAQDLLASRREHSKGDGNFPTPEPHMGMRDETPEDRGPRDLRMDEDDRSAPKGDVPAGQTDRDPDLVTRVPRATGSAPNPPGGMELVEADLEQPKREPAPLAPNARGPRAAKPKPAVKRPNARRSSAAKRDATRGARPRARPKLQTTRAAKDTEKNAKRRAGEARTRKRGPAATPRARKGDAISPRTRIPAKRRTANVQRAAARARGSVKPLTKRAAKAAGPNATQSTAQGGKKANLRTSSGRGRSGRR